MTSILPSWECGCDKLAHRQQELVFSDPNDPEKTEMDFIV